MAFDVGAASSVLRGHPIHYKDEAWRYTDNGALTETTWRSRPCGSCGGPETEDGHDHCLGELPGVVNACCGHGVIVEAYAQFGDGSRLAGNEAAAFFKMAKRTIALPADEESIE